jgi:hypothetical protein
MWLAAPNSLSFSLATNFNKLLMQLYVLINKEYQICTIEEALLTPGLASEGSSEITKLHL